MTRQYRMLAGAPVVEVTCNECGAVTHEPHWWTPAGWAWRKASGAYLDICGACRGKQDVAPVPVLDAPKRRRRRAA